MAKKLIAVVMGGKSAEYEVSMKSGDEVVKNLDKNKYIVRKIIISKDGKGISLNGFEKADICFLALHGPYGEDGSIQGMLELAGIKYTGSGVLASAIGINKLIFRKLLQSSNIQQPQYVAVGKGGSLDSVFQKLADAPFFVKPHNQGSSVGATLVNDKRNLQEAVNEAWKYSDIALVDRYIQGKEVTVPILGNKNPVVLPIIEIVPRKNTFFDYKSKYEEEGADEIIPAQISNNLTKKIQGIALEVYKILDCRGFGRVDFLLDKDNIPYVLEINTIPGLTPTSLFPKSAKAAGISYPQLLDKIIQYAIE
jgi:D-alanine-D-alanine ligase